MLTIEKQEIRAVRKDDIEAVSRLEEVCFKDPYPSYFLSELAKDNPETFLILTLNNRVIGYGVVDLWKDDYHLVSIAIHPEARRRGLGEKLLAELEKRLPKEKPLRLEVRRSNLAAIQLYSKRGFRRTGLAKGYYADGEDAITMEKGFVREATAEGYK